MLKAYRNADGRLAQLGDADDLAQALWIDLVNAEEREAARVAELGAAVPTLPEMEEIEISNRLYREGGAEYLTIVLPVQSLSESPVSGPVTFILGPNRLVSVRHHAPRPFETFPARAEKSSVGCEGPDRVFLGLLEEIVARIADLMEHAGRELDEIARVIFGSDAGSRPALLQDTLQRIGRIGELLGRLGLSLLSLDRALNFYSQSLASRPDQAALREAVQAILRDVQALDVHAEFLSNRIGLTTDATLGLIDLAQNATVRTLSVVATLFLPPTLIASIYGMNFTRMPELQSAMGYPAALALMVASAAASYLYFKWKGWL